MNQVKRNFTLAVALIVLLLNGAAGQNKTYFGLEFSVANDIYKIKDNGNYLKSIPLIGVQGGLTIRQELNKILFVETGAILKSYQQGFGFKTIPHYSDFSDDLSWIIPLRVGINFNLYKEKIYFTPIVGYSFGIYPPFGNGLGYGRETSNSTVIVYNYTESSDVTRYFSLLQTGLGFECKLLKTLLFSISANYYTGFNKIDRLEINYTVNYLNQMTGTATSKGEFWCISTGIKYPISNFWVVRK